MALPILRGVCEQAARAGLKVALYPHHGFHVARVEDALRLIAKARQTNLGLVFNLAHWLRSGDEPNFAARLAEALPHTMLVSINGADHEGGWDRLIQPLGQGAFDTRAFVEAFVDRGYRGPFGLQCYNIKGDREANAAASMGAWRSFAAAR
jgi:sugar phosphate isomerase/epimerase